MDISSAFSATAPNSLTGAAADQAKLTENYDDFLKLLTTQLKHQDPLEPMDSNEFVNQLTQFTEVEQSINSNKKLEQLLELQSANQSVQAIGFIGRTVEAKGDTAPLGANGVEFTYTLDALAASSLLVVLDANDKVVTSAAGNTAPGKHSFAWDGLDAAGNRVSEGNYRLAVAARDADDQQIGVTTGVISRVTGVESGKDGLMLSFGSVQIPIDRVISVRETKSESTGT